MKGGGNLYRVGYSAKTCSLRLSGLPEWSESQAANNSERGIGSGGAATTVRVWFLPYEVLNAPSQEGTKPSSDLRCIGVIGLEQIFFLLLEQLIHYSPICIFLFKTRSGA